MQATKNTESLYTKINGTLEGISYPCIAQQKYDGYFVTVYVDSGCDVFIVTKGDRVFHMQSHDLSCTPGVYLGELCYEGGDVGSLSEIATELSLRCSAVKDGVNIITEPSKLTIVLFDVISADEKPVYNLKLLDRLEILCGISLPDGNVKFVRAPSLLMPSKEELMKEFDNQPETMEGLIVKNLNESYPLQKWAKVKHCIEQEFVAEGPFSPVEKRRKLVDVENSSVPYTSEAGHNFGFSAGDKVIVRHYGIIKITNGKVSLRNPMIIRTLNQGDF